MPLSSNDLIVEDGTVIANANSYATIAFVDSYHGLRANTAWLNATVANKVAALVDATAYVDARWNFIGTRSEETQTLEWPRDDVTDRNGFDQEDIVPLAVKQATAEYALRALDGNLMPDPMLDDNGKFILYKREKVGPLEEETRYSESRGHRAMRPYPYADRLIASSGLVVLAAGRVVRG